MRMYVDDKNEYVIKTAIDAVIGRYGMRVRAVNHIWEEIFLRGATFFVEYEKGAEDLPNEVRADKREPNEKAGYLYCRRLTEIIDELADMNAVLFHIAALFGCSQKELLEIAYKKIAGREKNPEFMRKHPHKESESPVCGNCSNFENEDTEGDGFCNGKQTAEVYKHFEKRFNAIQ